MPNRFKDMLSQDPTRRWLDLSYIALSAEDIVLLAEALTGHETLTTLNLMNCNIEDASLLIDSLSSLPALRELNLSYNPLGKASFPSIVQLIKGNNNKLKNLVLESTQIFYSADAFHTFMSALASNTSLTHINVNKNPFSEGAIKSLKSILVSNRSLISFSCRDICLSDNDLRSVREAMYANFTLQYFWIGATGLFFSEAAKWFSNKKLIADINLHLASNRQAEEYEPYQIIKLLMLIWTVDKNNLLSQLPIEMIFTIAGFVQEDLVQRYGYVKNVDGLVYCNPEKNKRTPEILLLEQKRNSTEPPKISFFADMSLPSRRMVITGLMGSMTGLICSLCIVMCIVSVLPFTLISVNVWLGLGIAATIALTLYFGHNLSKSARIDGQRELHRKCYNGI